MTYQEVVARLAELWAPGRWRRLEIQAAIGKPGGYCMTADGRHLDTASALADPDIAALDALQRECRWLRIEMVGQPGRGFGGWCEGPDGRGFSLAGLEN